MSDGYHDVAPVALEDRIYPFLMTPRLSPRVLDALNLRRLSKGRFQTPYFR